jgi:hypothetical protein
MFEFGLGNWGGVLGVTWFLRSVNEVYGSCMQSGYGMESVNTMPVLALYEYRYAMLWIGIS